MNSYSLGVIAGLANMVSVMLMLDSKNGWGRNPNETRVKQGVVFVMFATVGALYAEPLAYGYGLVTPGLSLAGIIDVFVLFGKLGSKDQIKLTDLKDGLGMIVMGACITGGAGLLVSAARYAYTLL